MKTYRVLFVLVVFMALLAPTSAYASTCPKLEPGLPGFAYVVRGTLADIPGDGVMRLAVKRYYKGTGPSSLEAEVEGIGRGQRMDWRVEPHVGDEVVVAFRQEGEGLHNRMCNPFYVIAPGQEVPTDLAEALGLSLPTVSPESEAKPWMMSWVPLVGAVLVSTAAVFVISRRRW